MYIKKVLAKCIIIRKIPFFCKPWKVFSVGATSILLNRKCDPLNPKQKDLNFKEKYYDFVVFNYTQYGIIEGTSFIYIL